MTTSASAPGAPPVMRLKADPHHTAAASVSSWAIARRLPSALRSAARLGWAADRRALCTMLAAQAATAVLAASRPHRTRHSPRHPVRQPAALRPARNYSTARTTAAEIRACNMGEFLTERYRQVSDRLENEALSAALRALRVRLGGDALSSLAMITAWIVLGMLVATGHIALAAAGTALFAMRTSNGHPPGEPALDPPAAPDLFGGTPGRDGGCTSHQQEAHCEVLIGEVCVSPQAAQGAL
ncbi:hypothetical protein [Streptomyces sp. NPDC051214]|uniref:hypothetical protein n=1 Tax=Streptomyces sp. NPDC051214 TaxID=3155282 RepID=UPI00342A72AB